MTLLLSYILKVYLYILHINNFNLLLIHLYIHNLFNIGDTSSSTVQNYANLTVRLITNTENPKDDNKEFPLWAILVISIGGGLIVLGILAYAIYSCKKKNK